MADLRPVGSDPHNGRVLHEPNSHTVGSSLRALRVAPDARVRPTEEDGISSLPLADDDALSSFPSGKADDDLRGKARSLVIISDARGMLTVAEGGLESILDILLEMKKETLRAMDAYDPEEESDTANEQKERLNALSSALDDAASETEYNGRPVLNRNESPLSLLLNVEPGKSLEVSIESVSASALAVDEGRLDVSTPSGTRNTLSNIERAIGDVSHRIDHVAENHQRLSEAYDRLQIAGWNGDEETNRIVDADSARKEVEVLKFDILKQTGRAMSAQANTTAQNVASLFSAPAPDRIGGARIYSLDADSHSVDAGELVRRRLALSQGDHAFSSAHAPR